MVAVVLAATLFACASPDPTFSPGTPDGATVGEGAGQDDTDDAARRDAVFLTAVEHVLSGTVYEGLVDAIPGELLLGAATICARLDAGDTPEEVLVVYLDALGEEGGGPTVEDGRLAGSLVGAAVEVYCDHHEPALPSSRGQG